jgi:hypothetical protein
VGTVLRTALVEIGAYGGVQPEPAAELALERVELLHFARHLGGRSFTPEVAASDRETPDRRR